MNRKKLMIADDDPSILEAMKMMLEDEGYDVTTTVDGQVINKIKKSFPDLLLLDIWMSGHDGREICKNLKNDRKTKSIPVILVSANKDTRRHAKDAGADDFLAKPFEMDELLEKIGKYVN